MRWLLPILALTLLTCGPHFRASEPVPNAPEACCTFANYELTKFEGCRLGGRRCKDAEPFWMRGHVTCGPVDEAKCRGGRCCGYEPRYGGGPGDDTKAEAEPEVAPKAPPAEETKAEAKEETKEEAKAEASEDTKADAKAEAKAETKAG